MNSFLIALFLFIAAVSATTTTVVASQTSYGTQNELVNGACPINGASSIAYVVNGQLFTTEIFTYGIFGFPVTDLTGITSVKLNLTNANSLSQSGYVVQFYNTSTWSESTLSFRGSQNGCGVEPTIGLLQGSATTDSNGNLLVDVTDYVTWTNANGLTSSLRADLVPTSYKQLEFYSRHVTPVWQKPTYIIQH
jgi:hypothetical protein